MRAHGLRGDWHAPECPHHLPDAEPPATVRVVTALALVCLSGFGASYGCNAREQDAKIRTAEVKALESKAEADRSMFDFASKQLEKKP